MTDSNVKERFLDVNLEQSDSVAISYPVDPKRGRTVLVPLHIRACSRNPVQIDTQIRAFRHMRNSAQEVEKNKWRDLKKPEKLVYKANLVFLRELQGSVARGEVIWSEVAEPLLGADDQLKQAEATRRSNRKKRKTTPSNKDPPRSVTPISELESEENSSLSDDASADNMTANNTTPPPLPPPPLPPPRTMRPIVRTEDTISTVMLGDSAEVRSQEATRQRNKAKANNLPRREKGSGTTKVYQRSDAVTNDAIRQAEAHIALAAETMRPRNQQVYQGARRALISIDVNWCKDSRAVGGAGFSDADCERDKPAITIVGASDKEELVWVLIETMKALKHSDRSDVSEFATRKALSAHTESQKSARGQPSKTPVSGDTFLANRHNNTE